jgi:hypothetical protein
MGNMRAATTPRGRIWSRLGWWSEFRGLRFDSEHRLMAEIVVAWPEAGGVLPTHADAHELAQLERQIREARLALLRRSAEGNTN